MTATATATAAATATGAATLVCADCEAAAALPRRRMSAANRAHWANVIGWRTTGTSVVCGDCARRRVELAALVRAARR